MGVQFVRARCTICMGQVYNLRSGIRHIEHAGPSVGSAFS